MTQDTASATSQYDVIIVGAGPAGLSAARTMARLGFSTLVVDRRSDASQAPQPCSAIVAPVPGLMKGRRLLGDLFYPQLDLLIPLSLVVGYPRLHRFVSPGGEEVRAPFSAGDGNPVAAIDKMGLLKLMADQAERSGAEFRFGVEVTGLIGDERAVTGVRTSSGDFRASLVLVAEGASRELSKLAGLHGAVKPKHHALVLSRELEAPGVRRQHLGQITTLGRRYTSAGSAFGTVVMPLPGRASVTFTILSDQPHSGEFAEQYLDEYMHEDPRVRDLLADARMLHGSVSTMAITDGPIRVARRGLLSFGDAATPAGHAGLLPAIYMGRKAALIGAEALDSGDLSARRLGMYGQLFHNGVLQALRTERDLMLSLARTPDPELDRVVRVLSGLPLAAPFFAGWHGIPWEAARYLAEHYPDTGHQNDLVQRILAGDSEQVQVFFPAGLWSLPLGTDAAVS